MNKQENAQHIARHLTKIARPILRYTSKSPTVEQCARIDLAKNDRRGDVIAQVVDEITNDPTWSIYNGRSFNAICAEILPLARVLKNFDTGERDDLKALLAIDVTGKMTIQ